MPSTHNPLPIHIAWRKFLEKYQPKVSTLHNRPDHTRKDPALPPKWLECARKEWLLELTKSGCGPHSWPTLPEEIGQLQQVLQWRSSDMWHNVIGVSKLSAHDPEQQPISEGFSYQTWAMENKERVANAGGHTGASTARTTDAPTNVPSTFAKVGQPGLTDLNADTRKNTPRVAILSPRLYGLSPNLFHRIWTSGADSSGLKDYALLKWRALMNEFYSMAKEYGERMEEVLRRIRNEQDVEKLLLTYDHYHQQLANGVYKDWEQAISEWSEGCVGEKETAEIHDMCDDSLEILQKDEDIGEDFAQDTDKPPKDPLHIHISEPQKTPKRKKTSTTKRARRSSRIGPNFFKESEGYPNSSDSAIHKLLYQPMRSARSTRQLARSNGVRTHFPTNIPFVDENDSPPPSQDHKHSPRTRKLTHPRDIHTQSQHSPSIMDDGHSVRRPPISIHAGNYAQSLNGPPIRFSRGQSETMSDHSTLAEVVSSRPEQMSPDTRKTENQASMPKKRFPAPLPFSDEKPLRVAACTTLSRGATERGHHPESPFRDYVDLFPPSQQSKLPSSVESRDVLGTEKICLSASHLVRRSGPQYASWPSATYQLERESHDALLPLEISAEIEATYAEAGRLYAEKMRSIDDAYRRMEEGTLSAIWNTERQEDPPEQSYDSVLDSTESDIPDSTEVDTGSESDTSTPVPGSPVASTRPGSNWSLPSCFVELNPEDMIPMNSQWTASPMLGEQSGTKDRFRWTPAPEIRLLRR